jgi:hypothetical protein
MARRVPRIRLNRVDFPTLGRPTIATTDMVFTYQKMMLLQKILNPMAKQKTPAAGSAIVKQ